ncbi:DUF3179 domain-containing (seleno)protein [Algibacter sp. PT7-4]|uniref:DUF3179 domain-containing (seleno)protein n=1 Tax=Algibacter ulvanivorans TaxID=3400999 RepID=UPI003AAE64D9
MRRYFVFFISIFILNCSNNDSFENTSTKSDWIVDENDIWGHFFLYPLAINPNFESVQNINLSDGELVGVLNFGLQAIVYPYTYTFESEVINADYNGRKYAFTYCPITKSALAFHRTQIFRASGYLYKDNLTPWDDETESIWSQMLIKGIKGENKNKKFNTIPVLETTWGAVKSYFPNAKVFSGTASNSSKINSIKFNRLPPDEDNNTVSEGDKPNPSEHVYGIIDNFVNVHIFKHSDFRDKVVIKKIGAQEYIVIGNQSKRFFNAFKVDNANNFEVLDNQLPFVIKNRTTGIKYNILGVGNNGSVLEKPKYAYVAAWWAWEDFYSNFTFVNKEN